MSNVTAGGRGRVRSGPSRRLLRRAWQVVAMTTIGGVEHIETLAQRYLGGPYPCTEVAIRCASSSPSGPTRSMPWVGDARSVSAALPRSGPGRPR